MFMAAAAMVATASAEPRNVVTAAKAKTVMIGVEAVFLCLERYACD